MTPFYCRVCRRDLHGVLAIVRAGRWECVQCEQQSPAIPEGHNVLRQVARKDVTKVPPMEPWDQPGYVPDWAEGEK